MDREFANIGPFARATQVGKARQPIHLAKEFMRKAYGAPRVVLRNVIADAIEGP